MAKPTKQQWDAIKTELSGVFGRGYFLTDSYAVVAKVEKYKMRLMIAVYVNGKITGKDMWHGRENEIDKMPDIARRFYAIKSKGRSAKEIKQYERAFGKRETKRMGIYDRFFITLPYFSTPGAFIAHIKKHNQDIQIVDYDTYKAALDKHQDAIAPEVVQ